MGLLLGLISTFAKTAFAERGRNGMGCGQGKLWSGLSPFYIFSHAMREMYRAKGVEFNDGMPQVMLITKDMWEVLNMNMAHP